MNAAAEETEDTVTEPAPKGPGERLKSARQAAGLDLERVADRLHLKPADVEALERDAYDGFAARVFVRGYLRNYARVVGLPVDSVLAAFDAVYPDPDRPLQLKPVGDHKPQVSSRHGLVRMVSWLLLLGVVALFLVWWAGYLELNGGETGADVATEEAQTGAPAEAPPPAPEGGLVLPAEPVAQPEAEVPPPPPVEPAQQPVPATQIPEPEPLPATGSPEPAAVPAARVAEPQTAPAASTSVPQPQLAPPPAPEPTPAAPPQVVLTLDGPCWVEIRDSSNSFRLIGALQAGDRRVLGGQPPYRILLGNAPVARLTVGGEMIDLAPHMRGQVARLTLDPAAR